MVSSADILAAFREVTNVKQIERSELYGLLQDGIMAALAKKYGPNVQAEVEIDDDKGGIKMMTSPNGRIMTLRLRASRMTL